MKVTYLNHSGFLLEWESSYWLFDYYKGTLPEFDWEKELLVFCSHSHGDHFNPEIFRLAKEHPHVRYLFANEVKRAYKKLQRRGEELPEVTFLLTGTDTEVTERGGRNLKIHALHSTDCGAAFYITWAGKSVYHAGDLHWWTWPGEPEADNRKMAADFRKEISYLEERGVDVAFAPLDPRQEEDYSLGMNYLLSRVKVGHIFPMHFWDDFSIIRKYLEENQVPEGTRFHAIAEDGQSFYIDI